MRACGKLGHEKVRCYQLIGYPAHWNVKKSSKGAAETGGARLALSENEQGKGKTTTSEGPAGGHALFGFHTKYADHMAGNENWVLDSGASHHMSPLKSLFEETRFLDAPLHITVPTGNTVLVNRVGTVALTSSIRLQDVLYIPQFSCNLISIHKLTRDLKCTVTYSPCACLIQDQLTRTMISSGDLCDGVYILNRVATRGSSLAANTVNETVLWHARMGHPSNQKLLQLSSFLYFSFDKNKMECCDICHRSKQCRHSFSLSNYKADAAFSLIHCDLWEKYRKTTHGGASYFLTIVDDYTRAVWVYLLKEKSVVPEILISFRSMVQTQFNTRVKVLRSDNGTEFTNLTIQAFMRKEGILHETPCVGTPEQNGRVEHKHRHILNVARALRFQASLPISFWGECVLAAVHLINRTPTTANRGITPHEMLFGKPSTYDHLRVIGCLCYVKNNTHDKFGTRARRCVFVGYPQGQKGWKAYDLDNKEFVVSRDIVFMRINFLMLDLRKNLHQDRILPATYFQILHL